MAKALSLEVAFAQEKSHPEEIALAQQDAQVVEETQIEEPAPENTLSLSSQIQGQKPVEHYRA